MDFKAISSLIYFFTIYKNYFEDIFYNRYKHKNILKLLTSFIIIKPCVKYIKVGGSIELASHKDNSMTGETNSIT